MYNQVTDRYRFVEVEVIKAPPLIGRIISAGEVRTGAGQPFEEDKSVGGDTMEDSAIRMMPALSELMREEPET